MRKGRKAPRTPASAPDPAPARAPAPLAVPALAATPAPRRALTRAATPALTLALVLALGGAGSGCASTPPLAPSDAPRVLAHQVLDGPPPSTPGPHAVGFLTYGSGDDRQRPEYAEGVAFTTTAVDASPMARRTDMAGFWRRYWGFDEKAFPRNARVWYPAAEGEAGVEGAPAAPAEGPFPLVLVVHGNHDPRDYSDPGYAYLGELLASRGFLVVSVDMNFLNGSIRGENDARGWMLLKHLKAWEAFTTDPENPFFEKVDWERIALMGHSRGGEAVAHAAAFNQLRHYPDDASVTFDFGYRIRSLVAIAPVDGQYEPAQRPVPLEDVNYLVFHGSHDGDVTSFAGLRQFNRVAFSGEVEAFKSAVYVYRANHGQWNTGWGPLDNGPRSGRILRLQDLLPMEDQLEFARIYITAFLEATLLGEDRWLPLFRDHRVAGGWLPPTMYKTRFEHSSFRVLADYAEDIDLTTGSRPGVTLEGSGLSTWREGELVLRARLTPQRQVSQLQFGAWLGFHREEDHPPPAYTLTLEPGVAQSLGAGAGGTLDFQMAATSTRPGPPRRPEADPLNSGDAEGGDPPTGGANPAPAQPAGAESPGAAAPGAAQQGEAEGAGTQADPGDEGLEVELTVTLVDEAGASASLPLSAFGPLRKPLEVRVLRRADVERNRFPTLFEVVGHHFSLPLEDFRQANPAFRPHALTQVHFVFDGTRVGEVILSQVGITAPGEPFLAPRVPVALPEALPETPLPGSIRLPTTPPEGGGK